MKLKKVLVGIAGVMMVSQTMMFSQVSAVDLDGLSDALTNISNQVNEAVEQTNNIIDTLNGYDSQNTIDVVWTNKGEFEYTDEERQSFEDDLVSKMRCAEKFYIDLYGKAIDITLEITEMDNSFNYESDGFPGLSTYYDDSGHPIVSIKYSPNVANFYTLETLTHEYSHAFMCSIGVSLDTDEGYSLCEALCDVLGCSISAYTNNEYNWIQGHDPVYRDIAQCEYSWNGNNIDTISNYNDMDLEVGIYANSFILSNSAYLISQYFTEDIYMFSKLFVNSVVDIANMSGIGYIDCSKIVVFNALDMLSNQEITQEQFEGIIQSFKTNGMDYSYIDINNLDKVETIASLEYDGKTYTIYKSGTFSWEQAEAFCVQNNGHLITIETELENMRIDDFIYNNGVTDAFIGAYSEIDEKGNYSWIWSNTNKEFAYTDDMFGFMEAHHVVDGAYVPNNFFNDCKGKYLKYNVADANGHWAGTTAYGCEYFVFESNDSSSTIETEIGDINIDGTIDILDILLLKKHLLGMSTLEDKSLTNADINEDDNINILDIIALKNKILN